MDQSILECLLAVKKCKIENRLQNNIHETKVYVVRISEQLASKIFGKYFFNFTSFSERSKWYFQSRYVLNLTESFSYTLNTKHHFIHNDFTHIQVDFKINSFLCWSTLLLSPCILNIPTIYDTNYWLSFSIDIK